MTALALAACSGAGDEDSSQPTDNRNTTVTAEALDPSGSQSSEARTLAMIANVARQICEAPSQIGFRRTVSGGVEGSVNLSQLVRKFADVGAKVEAKAERTDWSGVLQEDLALALQDSNNCRQQVFNSLLGTFRVTERPRVPENLFHQLAVGSEVGAAEKILGAPFRRNDEDGWRMYRLLDGNLSIVLSQNEQGAIDCVFAWLLDPAKLKENLPLYARYAGRTGLLLGKSMLNLSALAEMMECSNQTESDSYQNVMYSVAQCRESLGWRPAFHYEIGTSETSHPKGPAELSQHKFNVLSYYGEVGEAADDGGGGSCLMSAFDAHAYGEA